MQEVRNLGSRMSAVDPLQTFGDLRKQLARLVAQKLKKSADLNFNYVSWNNFLLLSELGIHF